MTKKRELAGLRFGRLVVLACVGQYKANPKSQPKIAWRCRCDCGTVLNVVRGSLVSGLTMSCGCLNSEVAAKRKLTHGQSGSDVHRAWLKAKERCFRRADPAWKNYGGRGITMCPEWRSNFQAFADYMGPKPSKSHSIDRINNDGNYEPGNVRWATREQQARNRRRPKRWTHCKRGHKFTERNTYWVTSKISGRQHQSCRACRLMAESKRQRGRRNAK